MNSNSNSNSSSSSNSNSNRMAAHDAVELWFQLDERMQRLILRRAEVQAGQDNLFPWQPVVWFLLLVGHEKAACAMMKRFPKDKHLLHVLKTDVDNVSTGCLTDVQVQVLLHNDRLPVYLQGSFVQGLKGRKLFDVVDPYSSFGPCNLRIRFPYKYQHLSKPVLPKKLRSLDMLEPDSLATLKSFVDKKKGVSREKKDDIRERLSKHHISVVKQQNFVNLACRALAMDVLKTDIPDINLRALHAAMQAFDAHLRSAAEQRERVSNRASNYKGFSLRFKQEVMLDLFDDGTLTRIPACKVRYCDERSIVVAEIPKCTRPVVEIDSEGIVRIVQHDQDAQACLTLLRAIQDRSSAVLSKKLKVVNSCCMYCGKDLSDPSSVNQAAGRHCLKIYGEPLDKFLKAKRARVPAKRELVADMRAARNVRARKSSPKQIILSSSNIRSDILSLTSATAAYDYMVSRMGFESRRQAKQAIHDIDDIIRYQGRFMPSMDRFAAAARAAPHFGGVTELADWFVKLVTCTCMNF
jgi:hypothetical protein